MAGKPNPFSRAKAYPYPVPDGSYLLHDGGAEVIDTGATLPETGGLTPVLASGSNRSPEQLARKFAPFNGAPLPVSRVRLDDFDAVYSAHFARYGSIPATLTAAPGTTVTLYLTWLDDDRLRRMHQTEAVGLNYDFGRLDDISLTLEDGSCLDRAFTYMSRRGNLLRDGNPVPLAAVEASDRQWPEHDQEAMLGWARDRLAPDLPLEDFVTGTISKEGLRKTRTEALRQCRRQIPLEAFTALS